MTAQTARSRRSRLCARRQNHRTPCASVARQSSTSVAQHTRVGRRGPCLRSKPAKAPRTERRACPVSSWRLPLVCFFIFAHEAADASRVRRSVRPLDEEGRNGKLRRPRAVNNRGDVACLIEQSSRGAPHASSAAVSSCSSCFTNPSGTATDGSSGSSVSDITTPATGAVVARSKLVLSTSVIAACTRVR